MKAYFFVVALVHVFFMIAELFPWSLPLVLRIAVRKLPNDDRFSFAQQKLVSTLVHNAGIYNGIVAAGLFWVALVSSHSPDLARVMLGGAAAAGIFGTLTLKSPLPAAQAALGLIGLTLI